MKACPFCADEIQDAAVVCKRCGRDLLGKSPAAPAVGKVRQADWVSTTAKWGLGIFIVVFVLGLLRSSSTPAREPDPAPAAMESRRNPTAAQLARIVAGSDEKCPSARRIFLQGVNATEEMWDVECSTGKSFVVSLENSGNVKVLSCAALTAVSHVECFKTFDEQKKAR